MKLSIYIHKVLDACDDMLAALPGIPGRSSTPVGKDPRDIAMDLIIRSMAVMCAADGKLEVSEIGTSTDIYKTKTGLSLSEDQIRMTVSTMSLESEVFWSDLNARAGMLPEEVRRGIYNAALAVAMADENLDHRESAILDRLAKVLGHETA
jgi:tellurite resistance protein